MEEAEITIIGAGVVGLAIAHELAKSCKEIVVLEKKNSFGQETSSRNSEVIHGGMYYPQNTLKAKLCVEGRRLLYELCQKNNIAFTKIGKLIVATQKDEIPFLEELLRSGRENGVEGLRILTQNELKIMEPRVSALAALYSSETGIIDSHQLMHYLYSDSKDKGVSIVFDAEVVGIKRDTHKYSIAIKNNNEFVTLNSQVVINASGLDADMVAQMVGLNIEKLNYRQHYCKGQYFRVRAAKSGFINHLVYPVPKPKSGGLGIHATVDLNKSMRLGPDATYLNNRIKDYSVDSTQKTKFFTSARKFLPFIDEDDLSPDCAGIRPKLQEENGNFRDFIIREESDNGFSGFINLIGIESPGLTSCLAIAKFVKKFVENFMKERKE